MTDFEKIKSYYSIFNEQERLEHPEGRLEFDICMEILLEYLHPSDRIMDLGGGAGKYSIELSKLGFSVTLADLSKRLLNQAESYIMEHKIPPLEGIDVVNAIDLSCYPDNHFDTVILFGPLYHLLENHERETCISEVQRILKPNGIVIASFIPYLSGAVGIVVRALRSPAQVNIDNLSAVFETGKFNNNANQGFQEGFYPTANEIEQLFGRFHFTKVLLRSIRSFGYGKEEALYEMKEKDPMLFTKIMKYINKTANDPAMIETCGHAVYIGRNLAK